MNDLGPLLGQLGLEHQHLCWGDVQGFLPPGAGGRTPIPWEGWLAAAPAPLVRDAGHGSREGAQSSSLCGMEGRECPWERAASPTFTRAR